jgi:UPF0042 nucleotide-binding protein
MAMSTRPDRTRKGQRGLSRLRRARVSADEAPARSIEDFVIITGFSGAGKSQAMACFELADLFGHEGSKVEQAAVVCDPRGGEYFEPMLEVLDELDQRGIKHRLLFLEASEPVLIDRYKETRRRHPLAAGGQVSTGIRGERELLVPVRERADITIDTSELSASRLRKVVADKMLPLAHVGKLAVTVLSYGFKHGTPRDADLNFDVRFLPNPHYEAELRPLTGQDAEVREYVESSDGLNDFYERLFPLLDYLLPQYEHEGKAHLTIGIGCTGGRHRSVVIGEHIARVYRERGEYLVDVVHRDIDKPPRRA